MPVYVDAAIWPYGRMMMCHLMADSLDELHAMAGKIGIQRKWFQNSKSMPHYDICKSKRAIAITFGAIEVDRNRTVEIMSEWKTRSSASAAAVR